jgi:hypothetical protein
MKFKIQLTGVAVASALLALIGCQQQPVAPASSTPKVMAAAIDEGSSIVMSHDATLVEPEVYRVQIFVISVPVGTISANEDFWKRIDEQCVDPSTSDLLYKNGFRVGEAPKTELDHFARYMEGVPPISRFNMTGVEMKDMQIEMKKNLPEEVIFHFDKNNNAVGRTFDGSDNLMNISVEAAPRKPGQLRLTLCPMVRSTRSRLAWTTQGNELTIKFEKPENFYDVNFAVDMSPDSFLVVSPSADASRPTSLGNAFLIKDDTAERREQVMLVVFEPYKISGPGVFHQPQQAAATH